MPPTDVDVVDATLEAANVMLGVATRSIVEVEGQVTMPQLRVLMLLAADGPQNLSAVAAELAVHPSNATRTCEKLVRSGLLTRTDDPDDRRYVRLALTAAGEGLVGRVLDSRRRAVAELLHPLPKAEQRRIAHAFTAFAAAAGSPAIREGRFVPALAG